jgi:tRNA A-37 threonylcarbamoyl transferase component Bud32
MAATSLTRAERYELLDRIAVGGMAEVFRARAFGAHGFEKPLAIKRILPELARSPEFEARFIAEAKLAVKLSHANVVPVLDFGHLGGTLFIAMELIDGLDLAILLRRFRERGERVPVPAALHIAIEIVRGLDYAHGQGVVHRDVSPSNILLSRAGEVRIADFGIATVTDPRASGVSQRIMGKWRYMSPEQTRGEPMSARSDLFSAAAVLHELFTGERLFPGTQAEEIADNIRRMPLPRASEARPGLPPRLDEVLAQALERDPERRPARAAEVLRALIEISYESSIVASALDVADAVAVAIGDEGTSGAGQAAIDSLIRAQLGAAADPQRQTAVGAAEPPTGSLVRVVDADGVTHLEPERATVAAAPSALRRSVARPVGTGEEFEAGVAAVPTGDRAAAQLRRRVRRIALTAVVLAGAGVGGMFAARRGLGPDADPVAVVARERALVAPDRAELELDSVPAGAQVFVDGEPLAQATPTRAAVGAGRVYSVAFELAGYQRWRDDRVEVRVGERLRVSATLVPLRARLEVVTQPPGATVRLGDEPLGQTPLVRDDLAPGRAELTLTKDGYHPEVAAVILASGNPQRVERRLRTSIVLGKIDLHIVDSWAEVSENGRALGRAPGTLRLPVGRHTLRLFNPASRKQRVVTVDVVADRVEYYSFAL